MKHLLIITALLLFSGLTTKAQQQDNALNTSYTYQKNLKEVNEETANQSLSLNSQTEYTSEQSEIKKSISKAVLFNKISFAQVERQRESVRWEDSLFTF